MKKTLKIVMIAIILLSLAFSVVNVALASIDVGFENSFDGTMVETDDGTICIGAPLDC